MSQLKKVLGWVGLSLVLLSGCSQVAGTREAASTALPVVTQAAEGTVLAEATVEAADWQALRFELGGTVAAVLVDEGELVTAGQVLVRLDQANARIGVRQAEAALAAAQAQLAQVKAGARPEELAALEAELKAAQAGVTGAVAQRDELQAGSTEVRVAAAEAQLAAAQAQAWQAKDVYDQYGWRLGDAATTQWHAAQAAVTAAEAQVAQAKDSSPAQERAANAAVWAAAARRDAVQARLALAQAGATPEQIAAAEAAVQQAEAALAAAQTVLERTELRAPFAGTVTLVAVKVGDLASSAQPAVTLATLDRLQVRTKDLTEKEIVRVQVGQAAIVTVDALPGREFPGHVSEIGLEAVNYRGDITYPVVVVLDAPAPELRLGMTALVKLSAP